MYIGVHGYRAHETAHDGLHYRLTKIYTFLLCSITDVGPVVSAERTAENTLTVVFVALAISTAGDLLFLLIHCTCA